MNSLIKQEDFHIHDACILVNSYFEAVTHIFLSPNHLEAIYFRLLYSSSKSETKKENALSYFSNEELEELILEIDDSALDVNNLELSSMQEGGSHKVAFYNILNEKKHIRLLKTYQILKLELKRDQMQLSLYIKERIYSADGKVSEKANIQYEITFLIKELETSVLVYFKIELHPLMQISSPFNKHFRSKLHDNLKNASQDKKFRCNFENTESIVINSSRNKIFHIISNPTTYRNKDSVLEIDQNKGNLNVGDRFSLNMLPLQVKLEFEVIEHQFKSSIDEDCKFSCRMVASEPEHIKFVFTFTIKSINQNLQLLILKNVFEQALLPDFMKQHSSIKRATLKSFKTEAESVYDI